MTIPLINQDNKGKAIFIGYLLFCLLYFFSGHIQLYAPKQLGLSLIDKKIPFIPGSIWVYNSQLLFLFLALWICNDTLKRTLIYYSMLLATSIAFVIFLLIPTELPHQNINFYGINGLLWHFLYLTDTPTNCFPSLHVTLAILAACALATKNEYWRVIAPLWAVCICISTLTTKQHYLVDISGGVVLSILSLAIINYWVIPEYLYENTHE
jgi:membrane-associated phospholipid phosphatase